MQVNASVRMTHFTVQPRAARTLRIQKRLNRSTYRYTTGVV